MDKIKIPPIYSSTFLSFRWVIISLKKGNKSLKWSRAWDKRQLPKNAFFWGSWNIANLLAETDSVNAASSMVLLTFWLFPTITSSSLLMWKAAWETGGVIFT